MDVREHLAASGMDQEERPRTAAGLNRHQARWGRTFALLSKKSRKVFDSRSLKYGRQGKPLTQPVLNQGEQTHGGQRMSSELKEIVCHADRSNAQNLFPQLSELEFQSIAGPYPASFQFRPRS